MLKKLLAVSSISLLWFLLPINISICLADEPQPDTLIINSIDAYNDAINTNDQLHIVSFEISTTSSNFTATESYIFRFYSDGVEIATTTPYSYYNEGRSQGVVGFFFDADDADLPTWESANLTIELIGNPAITWDGDPPKTESSVWNSWSGRSLVGAKVRILAQALEDVWSIDLISPVNGVNKLTSYGEAYFEEVIPNLRSIDPNLFTSTVSQPSFPTENHTTTHGDDTMDRWLTSGNSTFDVTPLETTFGTSRNWIMSGLWVIASITMLCLTTYGLGRKNAVGYTTSKALKPALYLFGFMMIIGSFMGFMVMQVGLFCGIVGGLIIIFALFWRGSP